MQRHNIPDLSSINNPQQPVSIKSKNSYDIPAANKISADAFNVNMPSLDGKLPTLDQTMHQAHSKPLTKQSQTKDTSKFQSPCAANIFCIAC